MNRLLALQERCNKLPFGKALYSYIIARSAPYFLTIKPRIIKLAPHFCQISIRKRRKVENHLKTVHAIAMCNLCEMAAGICMEASIPQTHRWIPVGMEVAYVKKAKTDLTGTCQLPEIDWDTTEEVICFVSVRDTNDVEVMNAHIKMKVAEKKKK